MHMIHNPFLRCSRLLMVFIGLYMQLMATGQPRAAAQGSIKEQEPETIFVHSDKESYLAGELLWFKIYLLNAGSHVLAHYNSILYIELINDNGRSVIQSKIQTTRGTGKGSFYLPVNIATGAYTLVAYTNQMKQGDERSVFKKRILVTNTVSAAPLTRAVQQQQALIRFFPEGGTSVEGITSKVGIQVLDPKTTKGLTATGSILENGTDTVARFELLKFGLGQFTYTPLPGRKYTAAVTISGKAVIKTALPAPRPGGSVLNITDNGTDSYLVKIAIQHTDPQKMMLVAHSEQKNRFVTPVDLLSRNAVEIPVSKAKLGTGVISFTLFDQNRRPVNERLVFIPVPLPSKTITISTGKQALTAREHAPIQLIPGLNGDTLETVQGSLSVYAMDAHTEPFDIRAYLQLTASLSGQVEEPEFYFTPGAAQGAYIENLMLVNGWRRFDTDAPLFDPALKYLPEYDGHVVAARVLNKWNHQPAAGVSCLLTAPSVPFGLYNGTSDSLGIVRFNVKRYYGPGDIFIKPTPSANATDNYETAILSPFIDSANRSFTQPLYLPHPADSMYLLKRSIAMQTVNIYYKDRINSYAVPLVSDTLPFYGRPEISYQLDDYKRFSTMEEVLREYVRPVNVVMRDRKLHMTIYDEKYQNVYRYAVLVLLDGVPLADYNSIFKYDPYKIKRLDVVPRRYVIGPSLYSGIVSFQTYASKFDGFELDPTAVAIDYEGLQLQRIFYAPVYTNGDKGDLRIPDNRTTLLWEPDITLSGRQPVKLDCFTSDFRGTYRIVLQGISSKGTPVFSEATFTVK